MRGIAITRKNFVFLGSDAGGERAAILYTVLESAKLNGLDPQAWFSNVIDRMASGHPINRLSELLPWNLAAQNRHPRRLSGHALTLTARNAALTAKPVDICDCS